MCSEEEVGCDSGLSTTVDWSSSLSWKLCCGSWSCSLQAKLCPVYLSIHLWSFPPLPIPWYGSGAYSLLNPLVTSSIHDKCLKVRWFPHLCKCFLPFHSAHWVDMASGTNVSINSWAPFPIRLYTYLLQRVETCIVIMLYYSLPIILQELSQINTYISSMLYSIDVFYTSL